MSYRYFVMLLGFDLSLWLAVASFDTCERIDGDCPRCSHPLVSGFNPVAKVHLSNDSDLVAAAERSDAILRQLAPSQIESFDNPATGKQTMLFLLSPDEMWLLNIAVESNLACYKLFL